MSTAPAAAARISFFCKFRAVDANVPHIKYSTVDRTWMRQHSDGGRLFVGTDVGRAPPQLARCIAPLRLNVSLTQPCTIPLLRPASFALERSPGKLAQLLLVLPPLTARNGTSPTRALAQCSVARPPPQRRNVPPKRVPRCIYRLSDHLSCALHIPRRRAGLECWSSKCRSGRPPALLLTDGLRPFEYETPALRDRS